MSNYQHILVAVDVFSDFAPVLNRALELAGKTAKLSLIYVVEPVFYSDTYLANPPSEIQEQLRTQALNKFEKLGKELNIPKDRQIIEQGRPATYIHESAAKLQADAIVIGCHGRHGLQLLLGSTANAVLHGATCDVLAVRVGKGT